MYLKVGTREGEGQYKHNNIECPHQTVFGCLRSSGKYLLNGVNTILKRNSLLRSVFCQSACVSLKYLSKGELLVQHFFKLGG